MEEGLSLVSDSAEKPWEQLAVGLVVGLVVVETKNIRFILIMELQL